MPEDLRARVLHKIATVYPHLSKSRSRIGIKLPVFLTRNLLAPKRFADFVLRNLILADVIIHEAVNKEGRTPLEGLQHILILILESLLVEAFQVEELIYRSQIWMSESIRQSLQKVFINSRLLFMRHFRPKDLR